MRYDRGVRVMLVRDCVPGREVWVPTEFGWVPGFIDAVSEDGDTVSVALAEAENGDYATWVETPRYTLRFRDSAREGRDLPRDRAEAPALKPKLKPGQVAKLGILSNGDIVGKC